MFHLENLAQFRPKKIVVYLGKAVQRRIKKKMWRIEHRWYKLFGRVLPPAPAQVEDNNSRAASVYVPKVYPGRIIFFLDSETPVRGPHNPVLAWGDLAAGGLEIHRVPGKWMTIFREPHVQVLAEQLKACLKQARAKTAL
jgi:aspartate racemase